MRTEIVRCDECAKVIAEGTALVVLMVCPSMNVAPDRRHLGAVNPAVAARLSSPVQVEMCEACAGAPIELRKHLERAKKEAAEREEQMRAFRDQFGGDGGGVGFGG
jgi:hypothetical protein